MVSIPSVTHAVSLPAKIRTELFFLLKSFCVAGDVMCPARWVALGRLQGPGAPSERETGKPCLSNKTLGGAAVSQKCLRNIIIIILLLLLS